MTAMRGAPGGGGAGAASRGAAYRAGGAAGASPRVGGVLDETAPEEARLAAPGLPLVERDDRDQQKGDEAGESLPHSRRHEIELPSDLAGLRLRRRRRGPGLVEDLHGLEQVERALQLRIPLELLLRSLGHRRGGVGALATGRGRGGLGTVHHDVRGDALAVDRPALRREVLRGGQPQARSVGQRDDRLHRALAEALGAQHHRAAPVLKRAGHDLGGGGAALVDQHHHREVGEGALGVRGEPHVLVAHAALGVDHQLAGLEELLGHLDRGGQETARVVAQVQDEALDLALLGVLLQRGLQVVRGLLLELAQADVLDAGLELVVLHRLHPDLLPGDQEVLRLRPALAHDGDGDLAARLAAHALDRVGQLHVLGGEALDF